MLLEENVTKTEQRYRNLRRLRDVPRLKRALRDGINDFEAQLAKLSPADREAAMSLYLDRIRALTFAFHLEVMKQEAKEKARKGPEEPAALKAHAIHYGEELQRIGRLYEYL